MNAYPSHSTVPSHVVTWDEEELLELYRQCDDEW